MSATKDTRHLSADFCNATIAAKQKNTRYVLAEAAFIKQQAAEIPILDEKLDTEDVKEGSRKNQR